MPNIEEEAVQAMNEAIQADVPPPLEEAMPLTSEVRGLDAMLWVSVDPSLAAAHTLASGYMIEMIQGAAECFTSLCTALDETVQAWKDADEAAEADFQ